MSSGNWLGDISNPFNLRTPPQWWLTELAEFDRALVLYPSQETAHYRLARRASRGPGLLKAQSWGTDSAVCVNHKLIPVTSFGSKVTFGPHIFSYLMDRDTWMHGGAEKTNARLDEIDKAEDKAIQDKQDSENVARARSMWRTYNTRTGARVSLADFNRGRGQQQKRAGSVPVPPTTTESPSLGSTTQPTP